MSYIHFRINSSSIGTDVIDEIKTLNGTVVEVSKTHVYRDSQLNELLYVVIVIMFYAMALMVLIATQIRRQKREGAEVDYYDEYLERNDQVKSKQSVTPNMATVLEESTIQETVT